MSIWISKKEKSYAGSPTANWLKRYVEYLTKGMKETLEQEIVDHCDGTAFPHSADAINFEGSGSVQDAIQKEIADRKAADNEVRNRLTEEQQVRANAIQELAGDLTGKKPLDFVVRVTTTGMVAYGNYQFESADKSYAEILDAYNEGKNVYLLINNIRVAQLHSVGYAIQFFTTQGADKHIIFSVNAENTWQVKVNLYYTTDEVDNELTKKADVTALNKKADAEEVTQKFSDLESDLNNISDNVDTPLKLIKTITLTEAVAMIENTFEKPLKEIYMVFTGTLDGITASVSDCIFAARCDKGSQYFFYKGALKFAPNVNKAYIAHAKEIVERRWETVFADAMLKVEASGAMQGLEEHSANPRISYSTRSSALPRYIENLDFFVFGGKYSFAIGSTLEIYGVEVDE